MAENWTNPTWEHYEILGSKHSLSSGHGRQFRYFINLTSLTQGDEENRTR